MLGKRGDWIHHLGRVTDPGLQDRVIMSVHDFFMKRGTYFLVLKSDCECVKKLKRIRKTI